MKKRKNLALLFCVFALTIATLHVVPSFAMPNVYVYPAITSKEPGESFTISAKISGAGNVFAWEFTLGWNASVLNITGVEEGDFLKGIEETPTFFVNQTLQDEIDDDTVNLACTRLGADTPGASGSGTLATLTFVVERKGETALDFFETKLRDNVPNPIEHTSTDGLFTNVAGFPTASFTYSPARAGINEVVYFNANASSDPDGEIVGYFWDFGDGDTANETVFYTSHAYTEGGTYSVTLTVTDNLGWNSSAAKEVKIRFAHDIKILSVSASPGTVSAGDSVTITVIVSNEGIETESGFTVTVYYDDTAAAPAQTASTIVSGQNKTLTFSWDTADVVEGTYRIKAVASSVPGETYTTDNTRLGGTITVTVAAESPWLYYVGGVAAVAVIAVLALFLLRRRGKSAPPT
jgi:PKD repeat protein